MTISKYASVAFALLAGVAACTGGSAPTSLPSPSPRDPPPNERDLFAGPDDPGATRDVPPNDRDGVPGSTGGSASGPACDTTYQCTAADGGSTVHFTLVLETTERGCELVSQDAILSCAGVIKPIGSGLALTWKPYGSGGFTASSLKGEVTCIPGVATAPGGSTPSGPQTGGVSGSGGGGFADGG